MSRKRSYLPMTVAGIAREDVVTATPDSSVREIAKSMFDENVGSVVIVEDDEPVGIVTDRDRIIQILADGSNIDSSDSELDLDNISASDVMTADPLTVSTGDELPRVLHHMTDAHARRIPVVDDESNVAGILTLDDVVVHLAGGAHMSPHS